MPAPRSRPIKKPRISLSCIVCRRRKVRCGREQPECANCVRMKETCVYHHMVRDESTGRVRATSPQNCHSSGSELRPQRQARAHSAYPDHPQLQHRHQHQQHQHQDQQYSIPPSHHRSSQPSNDLPSNTHPHTPLRPFTGPSNPTMPLWEEDVQFPDDTNASSGRERGNTTAPRHLFDSAGSASCVFPTSTDSDDPRPIETLCRDHLSQRRGAYVRYIGPTFWGIVAGKESLSADFFDENLHTSIPPGLPLPHIDSIGMFNLLRSLPSKAVSDTLLESFFVAVWPLSPLIHPPTLQADYDQFWDWCRNNENALPSKKLREDPTLICLLFAVLYCGASAAPADSWTFSNLQGLQKETTASNLERAYMTSLSLCQYQDHPTLNTLVSTLLTRSFLDRPLDAMRNMVYVSTAVRIAQMMGLNREGVGSMLSPVDRWVRRRVWRHIVWLDVQSSISTGLNSCCGNEALEAAGILDSEDEAMGELPGGLSASDDSAAGCQSVAEIHSIGRFEMARLQARIVAHLQGPQGPTEERFGELLADAKQLLQKINSLIPLVSTQGLPGRGYISSQLANASPFTDPSLYKDDASQPTVFGAWTRIMFTLLKFELAILLRKPFLPPPDSTSPQSRNSWTSIVHLCLNYLRIYMQLYQTPAFAPYAWFCCNHYGPFQSVFLTLIYFQSFPNSSEVPLARYIVDEFVHHCVAHYQTPGSSSTVSTRDNSEEPESTETKMKIPLVIQVLVELHGRLDPPGGLDDPPPSLPDVMECAYLFSGPHPASKAPSRMRSTSNRVASEIPSSITSGTNYNCDTPSIIPDPPSLPSLSARSKPGLANNMFEGGGFSGHDTDFFNTISDLETWSSLILLDSEDILANPDIHMTDNSMIQG